MTERPLLIFPQPEKVTRSSKGGRTGSYHFPSHDKQTERLSPKFTELQKAFEERRIEIQQNTIGIEPEQVLVIETIGNIEDFVNAVRKVEGLEWLGEIEIEEILPDANFYNEKDKKIPLSGRLYLLMTNGEALKQLLSMWEIWKKSGSTKFPTGLNKFRNIFTSLKDIRRWDIQDRLENTGIVSAWQEDLEHDEIHFIPAEIELWFRKTEKTRQESQKHVESLINELGGAVISYCSINEIAYHAILAKIPAVTAQKIIENQHTKLTTCEGIMFIRPIGQVAIGNMDIAEEEKTISNFEKKRIPDGKPVVALLDGLPLSNHQLLAGRLLIDDPDEFGSDDKYISKERKHGTMMASLIVHGDINNNEPPLPTQIYVRPVMKPDSMAFSHPKQEVIADTVSTIDLIHRCVKRIFEGDGEESAIAPSIKVINISFGYKNRQFSFEMSPLARLLDWLSVKYNVLFVISAGNHESDIDIGLKTRKEIENLSETERQNLIIKALYQDSCNRRLLSPAESINSITVGAAHVDNSTFRQPTDTFDPFSIPFPSPISAFGSGYKKAIKPDIIFPGGRQLYRPSMQTLKTGKIESVINASAPGHRVAAPSPEQGKLDHTVHCVGSSNSAALASRAAAQGYEVLIDILQNHNVDYQPYIVQLLKAMIIHGSSWGNIGEQLKLLLKETTNKDDQYFRNQISKWLGYGLPDIKRVLGCTEQRATLLGFGELKPDDAHIFKLPLPPSLQSQRALRRVTATLAWLSPIVSTSQKYRATNLWFELEDNKNIATQRLEAQWQAVKRGTVQHEIFEDDKAVIFTDEGTLNIKINCANDATEIIAPIPYGLIVSFEVAENVNIAVYNEIRDRIALKVKVGQRS